MPSRTALTRSLLLAITLLLAPVSMRLWLWGYSSSGVLSDILTGLLLALLLARSHAVIIAPALLTWAVAQAGAVELVEAVGRLPELTDAEYLTDPAFVSQSAGGGGLSQPFYLCALLVLALLTTLFALRQRPATAPPRPAWLVPALLLALHGSTLQLEAAEPPWKQYNIVHHLAAGKVFGILAEHNSRADQLWAVAEHEHFRQADLNGVSLLPGNKGKARNLLIVTLEGIPGAYIDQVRTARGYQWEQQPMPLLSAFAREHRAMHTADYVLHNHQTIRGLYAMLCGDWPKLDSSTPKAIEMLASASHSEQHCLPAQLTSHGFATHFLQATGLAFMSKDRIMPHIGFQKTCGDNCISTGKKGSFVWGLDDKAFFKGALGYINGLRQQQQPWMLTLLTVGTHQPYGAPLQYLERHGDPKMAAVAYLDEAVTAFLGQLEKKGVFEDTLVIVTSDESHGVDELRLASAWGLSLVFAPERQQLPEQKTGVYGQVDLPATVLDYFGLPVHGVTGRSQFRDYRTGRSMVSYTNGMLRYQTANGLLHECQVQAGCRAYQQDGFLVPTENGPVTGRQVLGFGRVHALAQRLDSSLELPADRQDYLFASEDRRKLKSRIDNDWTDNLIGAQYLEFASGSRTHVTLRIKALKTDQRGAQLYLALKEFDQTSDVVPPALPVLRKGETLDVNFEIENPKGRKAFSFHLLGSGPGEIQIDEFRVSVNNAPEPV